MTDTDDNDEPWGAAHALMLRDLVSPNQDPVKGGSTVPEEQP